MKFHQTRVLVLTSLIKRCVRWPCRQQLIQICLHQKFHNLDRISRSYCIDLISAWHLTPFLLGHSESLTFFTMTFQNLTRCMTNIKKWQTWKSSQDTIHVFVATFSAWQRALGYFWEPLMMGKSVKFQYNIFYCITESMNYTF